GGEGKIFKTTNSGLSWVMQSSNTTADLKSVCFVTSNTGWVVGNGIVLKTSNSGNILLQRLYSSQEINSVAVNDNGYIFIANGLDILRSMDGGLNWSSIKSNMPKQIISFQDLYIANNIVFVASEKDGIFYSPDNGNSWDTVLMSDDRYYEDIKRDVSCIYVDRYNNFYVGCVFGLYVKQNGKRYFDHLMDFPIIFIQPSNMDYVYCGGSQGRGLLRVSTLTFKSDNYTFDLSTNIDVFERTITGYAEKFSGYKMISTAYSLYFLLNEFGSFPSWIKIGRAVKGLVNTKGYDIYSIGEVSSRVYGTVQKRMDDNWRNYWSDLTGDIAASKLFFDDKGFMYVCSKNGLYRTPNSVVTEVKNNESNKLPARYQLKQNYPNPFNPVTTINYSLPKSGVVSLKIYDILGREIKTLVNEEKSVGNYSIKFDGSNLSNGVYFYRIQTGDFSQTKKLILLK
ncbi:MAG: T9SS type A sorting domain-containing protein, partial [Chitinophagaceae bacterium]|nr:T9SS type A sorting domain-containing protein [Chitinophagaceae bacterium]